jgi:glycosyltransferase involved in cell wall biosynthesis
VVTVVLLKWFNKCKVIIDIDDWIFEHFIFVPFRFKHLIPLLRAIASYCVVSSRHLQKRLETEFSEVRLIPTFVDIEKFSVTPKKAEEPVVFSWNGTLFDGASYESVLLMIEAYAMASRELEAGVGTRLDIVGDGAYLPRLKREVFSRFPKLSISFTGWFRPEEMADYLKSIDVGLYSLQIKSSYNRVFPWLEDFYKSKSPTKLFEYMAMGRPTIATRVGEAPYFIEEGKTGFLGSDPAELALHFVTLAKDPELRQEMGSQARQRCEECFSTKTVGQELRKLFQNLE